MAKIKKIIDRKCPLCNNLSLAQVGDYIFCLSSCGCKYTDKPEKEINNETIKMRLWDKMRNNNQSSLF